MGTAACNKFYVRFTPVTNAVTIVYQGRLNRAAYAAKIGKPVQGVCLQNLIKEIRHWNDGEGWDNE